VFDPETLDASLPLLLKYEADAQRVLRDLPQDGKPGRSGAAFGELRRLLGGSSPSVDN
jgi:hypothetical protein